MIVLVLCLAYRETVFGEIWAFSVEGAALTLVFIAAVRFYDWPLFRVLNSQPLAHLGLLSYSLYLIHDVLLRAAARLWPQLHGWQRLPIALAASIAIAWTIYRFVERPCADLRRKLTA